MLSANKNIKLLLFQAKKFNVKHVVINNENKFLEALVWNYSDLTFSISPYPSYNRSSSTGVLSVIVVFNEKLSIMSVTCFQF